MIIVIREDKSGTNISPLMIPTKKVKIIFLLDSGGSTSKWLIGWHISDPIRQPRKWDVRTPET